MKTYFDADRKRTLQKSIIPRGSVIYGLGGPNINNYVNMLKRKGYKKIISFENDWGTYLTQKRQNPKCELVYGNILNNLNHKGYYDYDFCSSIKTMEKWLPQIISTPQYSTTFSLRGVGYNETLRIFGKYGQALHASYYDTSTMITFFNNYLTIKS